MKKCIYSAPALEFCELREYALVCQSPDGPEGTTENYVVGDFEW